MHARLTLLSLSLGAVLFGSAQAHDHDKIRVGINIGTPEPQPVYVQQPVVVQQQVVVVPQRQWVEGHYEERSENVCVQQAGMVQEYVPAVVETRQTPYGRPYTVMVSPAGYRQVAVPARYETRTVRTFVPGHFVDGPPAYVEAAPPAPVVYTQPAPVFVQPTYVAPPPPPPPERKPRVDLGLLFNFSKD